MKSLSDQIQFISDTVDKVEKMIALYNEEETKEELVYYKAILDTLLGLEKLAK